MKLEVKRIPMGTENDPEATLPVILTTTAWGLAERELNCTVLDIMTRVKTARLSTRDMHVLLWAALEGARRRGEIQKLAPYSLDEVSNLIDDRGGPIDFWNDMDKARIHVLRGLIFASLLRQPAPDAPKKDAADTVRPSAATTTIGKDSSTSPSAPASVN